MAEATIRLRENGEARFLFGPQDLNLRRLQQKTGASIVLRGTVIRIQGEQEQVDECQDILAGWQTILHQRDELLESDVQQSLDPDMKTLNATTISPAPRNRTNDFPTAIPAGRGVDQTGSRGAKDKVEGIRPKTPGQELYVNAMLENALVFCDGPAGCGKTYLAVAHALKSLRREEVRKIVLVRPAVEAGEKLGFLPGDMFAKVNPFLRPLLDAMNDMLDFDQVRRYLSNDVIEIVPLAFMRGRTLNDTFIILDEGQNTTITQMKMFLTRMGVDSRIVVTGDATQNDLPSATRSGLLDGITRLSDIEGVAIVRMTGQDIVRHRLVREIVSAYETTDPGEVPES